MWISFYGPIIASCSSLLIARHASTFPHSDQADRKQLVFEIRVLDCVRTTLGRRGLVGRRCEWRSTTRPMKYR